VSAGRESSLPAMGHNPSPGPRRRATRSAVLLWKARLASNRGSPARGSSTTTPNGPGITVSGREIVRAAASVIAAPRRPWRATTDRLSRALASLINVLDPPRCRRARGRHVEPSCLSEAMSALAAHARLGRRGELRSRLTRVVRAAHGDSSACEGRRGCGPPAREAPTGVVLELVSPSSSVSYYDRPAE